MSRDLTTIDACIEASKKMNPDTECVHIHADGSVSIGTDYQSTFPADTDDIYATWHPGRARDPWDCFEKV